MKETRKLIGLAAVLLLAGVINLQAQTPRTIDFIASTLTWTNHAGLLNTNVTTTTAPWREFYGGESGGTWIIRGLSTNDATSLALRFAVSQDGSLTATNPTQLITFPMVTNLAGVAGDFSFNLTAAWTEAVQGSPYKMRLFQAAILPTNAAVSLSNVLYRTVIRR